MVFQAVLLLELPAAPPAQKQTAPDRFVLRWTPNSTEISKPVVEVFGLSAATLQELGSSNRTLEQWHHLFAVYAEQGDLRADIGLPPMVGAYLVETGVLRFVPQFPLEPGLTYRAVFRTDQLPGERGTGSGLITAVLKVPSRRSNPTTAVSHVYPSGALLPENLLKFYVHFSAPMSRGRIYDHIQLRDASGKQIDLPFLEIDEELWDPTMTRLTLFIDPGRIKRGVRPLEEVGPALEMGKRYILEIDQAWKDGAGCPLRETFQKTFEVGPPDREPPDPARWRIRKPKSGTREPLTVRFFEPMDHALAARVIRVADNSGGTVAGNVSLQDQECRWTLVPRDTWRRGTYKLEIQRSIEDLAGNNIGKPFEVDLFERVERRPTHSTIAIPFEVR
jgi:hypothetical protein